ncbi:MAG TPA: GNAT family N-acetyltransferase [Hyphomonadaceae bacterium]|jgi:GNAT superfamily N-acetyltransferase|nr:GNAT family N-acetyltransferase [Hyphomonadaceae bacterium]
MATVINETAPEYRVRPARGNEVGELQNIDIASASLFRGTGLIDFGPLGEPSQPIPEERLRKGFGDGLIWVVVDNLEELVGFALCSDRGEDLYLDQLSVLPRHGRHGLGTRLVRRCLQEAEARSYKRVSLSTFRKVPWNGPFYKKLGFREVPSWRMQDWQNEIRELQKQTMDVKLRCFMARQVKR